jgi:hypothetical protein
MSEAHELDPALLPFTCVAKDIVYLFSVSFKLTSRGSMCFRDIIPL